MEMLEKTKELNNFPIGTRIYVTEEKIVFSKIGNDKWMLQYSSFMAKSVLQHIMSTESITRFILDLEGCTLVRGNAPEEVRNKWLANESIELYTAFGERVRKMWEV
jgi:hypothetical protein